MHEKTVFSPFTRKHNERSLGKLVILIICAFVFSAFMSHATNAATYADSPCDPNYYQSLEARAWLEAQREITQNQNLIFKPDSVLEYTCFDKHLKPLAQHATAMFSETTRWGTVLGTNQSQHMDDALTALVGGALNAYNVNYNHKLLGDRNGSNYVLSSSVSGGDYACEVMKDVWKIAKCMNFAPESNDGFFTFAEYASDSADKRKFPASNPCSSIQTLWENKIEEAIPPSGATTPWKSDNVVTYFDKVFPASGCGPVSLGTRFVTGLIIRNKNKDPQEYYEHVCVAPGCYWEPEDSSINGGECVQP